MSEPTWEPWTPEELATPVTEDDLVWCESNFKTLGPTIGLRLIAEIRRLRGKAEPPPAADPTLTCTHLRVYYALESDNFYCGDCRKGQSNDFFLRWKQRWREFGQTPETASALPGPCPLCGADQRPRDAADESGATREHLPSCDKGFGCLCEPGIEAGRGEPTGADHVLLARIEAAIQRISKGLAPMRVPADQTDPDIVLVDCRKEIVFLAAKATRAEQERDETKEYAKRESVHMRAEVERIQGELVGLRAACWKDYGNSGGLQCRECWQYKNEPHDKGCWVGAALALGGRG